MTSIAMFIALSGPVPMFYSVPGVAISFEAPIHYWADIYGVQRSLARKVAEVESAFNPRARSFVWELRGDKWFRTAQVIARGLFQIAEKYQDAHARDAGMAPEVFQWWNPSHSARAGLRLLKWLLNRYDGDQYIAVASYNAGFVRIESALPMPKETIRHLKKVFG